MKPHPGTASALRRTNRLEAFSDAVLAIAMTLPLTELVLPRVPQGGDLAAAFAEKGPDYVSYIASSAVIGLYWAHSHFSGKIVRATDHTFNLISILFVVAVSATSVPNTPFFDHIGDPANVGLAATVYAAVLAGPSLIWLGRWIYAVRARLVDPRLDRRWIRRATQRYAVVALVFVAAAVITALGWWRVGMSLSALAVLSYVLPPLRPQYIPGGEPATDLEEADER